METHFCRQGAQMVEEGVRYCAWAPRRRALEVQIFNRAGAPVRRVPLAKMAHGFFAGLDHAGRAGDRFKMRLDGGEPFPPPAAHWLPSGVHGPAVVEPEGGGYTWRDSAWRKPPFRDLVLYELHVGTFTPEGTFGGVISKLPYLRRLGVNAIEIMPVGDFPGARNWGYDGVQPYAPARCYGTPNDFRALVDAAHRAGLAVILDVVYNHLGPDGNYLGLYSPFYFSQAERTPWGEAVNFGHAHSGPVRAFCRDNLLYWLDEFHLDGFRLDATHAIFDSSTPHILRELAEAVQQRGAYIIAEDARNEVRLVQKRRRGGYGMDAVWADDFHHTVEVAMIDASVYRLDFTGELRELAEALRHGWVYRGKTPRGGGKPPGTPCGGIPPERFIYCISNHDQVGNRILGERLNHLVTPATYRAASALLLLVPYTPLLFMGQEWAASTPFQFFTDHHPELGVLVEQGRRKEFRRAFAPQPALAELFPPPQDRETFLRSKLRWAETGRSPHAPVLALYRAFLRLRRAHAAFRPARRGTFRIAALRGGVLAMRLAQWLVLCDLQGGHGAALTTIICRPPKGRRWRVALSSHEKRFGGHGRKSFDAKAGRVDFSEAEVLVLRCDAR